MKIFHPGFVFCLLVLTASFAFSREAGGPINIEADRMETDQKKNIVLFSGAVEARQDDLVIQAEKMTVHYMMDKDKKNGDAGQAISTIDASGNVRISKQNWVAGGDELEYDERGRKVVLTGNAKVWQDNNMVTGERIVLYLDEGRSVVDRSKEKTGRVKAFFYPDDKDGKKK